MSASPAFRVAWRMGRNFAGRLCSLPAIVMAPLRVNAHHLSPPGSSKGLSTLVSDVNEACLNKASILDKNCRVDPSQEATPTKEL